MINLWNNNLNPISKIFSYEFFDSVNCDSHINIWGEFLIVFEGTVVVNIYDNQYCVNENEVVFINSLIPHGFKTKKKMQSCCYIFFNA